MLTCPRCDNPNGAILSASPVKGVWIMYSCPRCFFTWRSTEPENIVDPDLYNKDFKLTEEMIDQAEIIPPIGVPRQKFP